MSAEDNQNQREDNDNTNKSNNNLPVDSSSLSSSPVLVAADEPPTSPRRRRKRDVVQDALRRLAQLSLEDYEWRSSMFKSNEADRRIQESLARMLGEDPSYVRPMDASDDKIGPLGLAEKDAVTWLSKVMDEEGKRARQIVNSNGALVRPIEAALRDGAIHDDEELGPLAKLELQVVDFFNSIRSAETERVRSGVWQRPKDLAESIRGPLGEAEFKVVSTLQDIQESEKLRMQQSRQRGGEIVRPIDIPGPLGELEMAILEVIEGEQQRVKEAYGDGDGTGSSSSIGGCPTGKILRPKDAKYVGPLGVVERQAVLAVERLTEEERERLRNIKRVLEENRPMEADRSSLLGMIEAFIVGLLRAPRMIMNVMERVKELLQSEPLDETDQKLIKGTSTTSFDVPDRRGPEKVD